MPKNELTDVVPLDVIERKRLKELVAKVDKWHSDGIEIIWPVLEEIRRDRLYRESHETFEAFCRERWDWGRNYVNKIIAAQEVRHSLGTVVPKLAETITTERQLRELVSVPDDDLPAVAAVIQEKIDAGETMTARAIKQAVAEVMSGEPEKTEPPKAKEPEPVDWSKLRIAAIRYCEAAMRAIDDLQAVKRFHDHPKAIKAIQAAIEFLRNVK